MGAGWRMLGCGKDKQGVKKVSRALNVKWLNHNFKKHICRMEKIGKSNLQIFMEAHKVSHMTHPPGCCDWNKWCNFSQLPRILRNHCKFHHRSFTWVSLIVSVPPGKSWAPHLHVHHQTHFPTMYITQKHKSLIDKHFSTAQHTRQWLKCMETWWRLLNPGILAAAIFKKAPQSGRTEKQIKHCFKELKQQWEYSIKWG